MRCSADSVHFSIATLVLSILVHPSPVYDAWVNLMCSIDAMVGTEELAHEEIIGAIMYQLTRNLTPEEIMREGFDAYYVNHTTGVYPCSAAGVPFSATAVQSKGDALSDLFEDLAAEQKARTTYDNLIRMIDDPDILEPLRFLREREVVHFQRFGDALRVVQDNLDAKNYYAYNPEFDVQAVPSAVSRAKYRI